MGVLGCVACSCACAVVHACLCPPLHPTALLSLRSFGSGGNVTPVPRIAASLDPGNSDDRNRHLLPLQHTHCLATGSPHTFPKPFSKGVLFVRWCYRSSRSRFFLFFFPLRAHFVIFLHVELLKGAYGAYLTC